MVFVAAVVIVAVNVVNNITMSEFLTRKRHCARAAALYRTWNFEKPTHAIQKLYYAAPKVPAKLAAHVH